MSATGLSPNTREMSLAGRESQSIAFSSTPGIRTGAIIDIDLVSSRASATPDAICDTSNGP